MKVFLGQALGSYIDEKDIKITEKTDEEGVRKDRRSIILCSPASYSKCRKY